MLYRELLRYFNPKSEVEKQLKDQTKGFMSLRYLFLINISNIETHIGEF